MKPNEHEKATATIKMTTLHLSFTFQQKFYFQERCEKEKRDKWEYFVSDGVIV